jgi:hypothetical protein
MYGGSSSSAVLAETSMISTYMCATKVQHGTVAAADEGEAVFTEALEGTAAADVHCVGTLSCCMQSGTVRHETNADHRSKL